MQLAFQELYALVNSDAAGSSSQHSSVDSCMLQAWREHLQQQMEQPSFAEMLKIIINETFVDYDRSQVCLSCLRMQLYTPASPIVHEAASHLLLQSLLLVYPVLP